MDTICCEGNVAYMLDSHCDSIDTNGNPVHSFAFQFNYNGSNNNVSFYATPSGGVINQISTNSLQPGSNVITGAFTDTPPCQNMIAKALTAHLTIAPNPNDGNCIISYNFTEPVENPSLEIIDEQGRAIQTFSLRGMAGYIPINMQLSKGVYPVFLIGNGKRIAMKKWVIQ